MKKLRVMVLMHESLVPPDSIEGLTEKERQAWQTEWDVCSTLRDQGHEVHKVGVSEELAPIRKVIKEAKPHVAFNLLEEFKGEGAFDQHVVSYLELMGQAYTGCNPRGLTLSRDKALAKKILFYHRIPMPKFQAFRRGRAIKVNKKLAYPLIVKSLIEEASYGISQASVVNDYEQLVERVTYLHEKLETDAIAETYIDGREVYMGVIGNRRLDVFPPWELHLGDLPSSSAKIATAKVKWDLAYQRRHRIRSGPADLSEELRERLVKLSKRVYRQLGLSGYARMDFRVNSQGRPYLLEANPNPCIAWEEDFAACAEAGGLDYADLLHRVISLGRRYARALPA